MRKLMLTVLILTLVMTAPALAVDKLKMGVPPYSDAARTLKMFKPMADAISLQVGVPVDVVFSPTLEIFMERVKNGEFDVIQANHMSIIQNITAGYEVFSQPKQDGMTKQHGLLVVRKDSGINSIKDLKGKTIGFSDDQAVSGYVLNRALLKDNGVDLIKDTTVKFFGKHDAALAGVYNKQADAAGVRDNTLAIMKDKLDIEQLKVLGETDWVPTVPFAVKKGLDPALAAKIKATVLAIPDGDPIWKAQSLDGIVPAGDKEMEPLRILARKLGL